MEIEGNRKNRRFHFINFGLISSTRLAKVEALERD